MPKRKAPERSPLPVVATEEELRLAVDSLAAAISRDHPAGEPLVIVAVLKGAVVFLADLIRRLTMPLEVEFVVARGYEPGEAGVRIGAQTDALRLAGRRVLIVDCILDTGRTLSSVREALDALGPADLKMCVLLSKRRKRQHPVEPDYVGLEIPDVFVVGYGLDRDGQWRGLPYLACHEGGRAPEASGAR